MVDIRVTRGVTEAMLADAGPILVTRQVAQAMYADRTNPIRITRQMVQVLFADRTNSVRVTRQVTEALMSTRNLPPIQPDRNNLMAREANPFAPTAPTEIESINPILHDFVQQQTASIRQAHDTMTAGDSTVPWEFLTKIGSERLYTLGSLGRFYHDDYGIVLARYCQFSKVKDATWLNGPVGLINKSKAVDWQVTNDLALSSADAVVGILASYTQPKQADYGWVLTQGANITALLLQPNVKTLDKNQGFVWADFEQVSTSGKGRILGRAIGPVNVVNKAQHQIDAGGAYINVEGPSIDSLSASLGIDTLKQQVAAATDPGAAQQQTDLAASVARLKAQMLEVQAGIGGEANARTQADAAINATITGILAALGGTTLAAIYARITAEQLAINDAQDLNASRILAKAQSALDMVIAIQNADYQGQIDELRAAIAGKIQKGLIPLVDGSVPPMLVYLPSGELVFVEITL
jgi:hypothetical protein